MSAKSAEALNIVFMGSSDFAVPALEALRRGGHNIPFVVTQPDRIRGRGGKVLPTPVGLYAGANALPTLKPERIKGNDGFIGAVQAAAPDLIVVAAYGKILPKLLLDLPLSGCVNIHASLLPEYRGAAPVQRAILDGKAKTGVTLIYMAEGLDDGDMIAAAGVDVGEMNAGELTAALAKVGAELLLGVLPDVAAGTAPRFPQDGTTATYAEKIEKAEGRLDLKKPAVEIMRRVRAMTPAPGAWLQNGDERIVITAARALGPDEDETPGGTYEAATPGKVLYASSKGIGIRTGDGVLLIEEVKAPGRKAMPVREYLKGNTFVLTEPLE